jgi:hypothetical protein
MRDLANKSGRDFPMILGRKGKRMCNRHQHLLLSPLGAVHDDESVKIGQKYNCSPEKGKQKGENN